MQTFIRESQFFMVLMVISENERNMFASSQGRTIRRGVIISLIRLSVPGNFVDGKGQLSPIKFIQIHY